MSINSVIRNYGFDSNMVSSLQYLHATLFYHNLYLLVLYSEFGRVSIIPVIGNYGFDSNMSCFLQSSHITLFDPYLELLGFFQLSGSVH